MRIFKNTNCEKQEIEKVFCNICGKEIEKDIYGYHRDYLHIEKDWGYNSNKDGENHSIDICEECYDNLIKSFKIKA